MSQVALVQHVSCKNDVNGNPRRVYVGYDLSGDVVLVDDEGYRGRPEWARGLSELPGVSCTPTEYRGWMKRRTDIPGA